MVNSKLADIAKSLDKEYEKSLLKATIHVHRELTRILTGTRSGFTYNVAGTGKVILKEKTLANGRKFYYRKLVGAVQYTASAPFEAPASRLGHLRTSYKYLVKGSGKDAIGIVGSPLDYSHYLEYGTSNMHPRPHLRPAFQKSKKQVEKYFEGLLE